MRTIATVGDIYGPDAGQTFYNENNGAIAGQQGTNNGSPTQDNGGAGASVGGSSINPVATAQGIQGTILSNGVFLWFLIAFTLIGIYAWAKKVVPNVEGDLAVPRVSIPAWLSIGVQAFLFLVLVKTILKKYNVPGLSGLAALA